MQTTLNQIRAKSPCADGWKKLLAHLGKTQADDEPLSIVTILDSNGLDDAFWCLQAVEGCDREIRRYAVWCARQVQHLMADARSVAALDVAERFTNGDATREELTAAGAAAWAAAWAAGAAAWAVGAAGAAAGDAAWAAAWAAGAAGAAARAAGAARAAAWAAGAARAAARAAEDAQEARLRELCAGFELTAKE